MERQGRAATTALLLGRKNRWWAESVDFLILLDILFSHSISKWHCGGDDLVKNGRSENGTQRQCCNKCGKIFQHEYTYKAWKLRMKEQIEKQTMNSCGFRDISRNLDI
ncbi:MAG: IS1/IS1595 family N-terminal zinc-binding domain-containing protein [Candidatus Electronema sp. VV]